MTFGKNMQAGGETSSIIKIMKETLPKIDYYRIFDRCHSIEYIQDEWMIKAAFLESHPAGWLVLQ